MFVFGAALQSQVSGAEPWDPAARWNTHRHGGLMVLGGARAGVSGVRAQPGSG